jgi:ABC-type transport system involved in multi-copper enzyme maturation permease subunit
MKLKTFWSLVRWSFEEFLNFPMLEVIIATAIIGVLSQTTIVLTFNDTYGVLYQRTGTLFMFITFSVSAVFAHGFAGSSSKGEDKLLLSYPVKRWHLFMSKFVALFFTIVVVFFVAYSMHIYLSILTPLEPQFFVGLFGLLLQILLVCAITITVSLFSKNEAISILSPILLLIGLETVTGSENFLSAQGRLRYLSTYLDANILGRSAPGGLNVSVLTSEAFFLAFSVPLIISMVLLVISFVYFNHFIEVD